MADSGIRTGIKVEGAKELRKAIRDAESKDLKDELKAANKAAAVMVADKAKNHTVPVSSGALAKSISALGSATKGQVKAGKKSKNTQDYAGVVHYGDPHRNREPQPFLNEAMSEEWDNVYAAYEAAVNRIVEKLSA